MAANPQLRGNPYIVQTDLKFAVAPGEGSNRGGMLRQAFAVGAAADTNIAIAGISPNDKVMSILDLTTPSDLSAQISVISAGNIQLAVSTVAKNLWITWLDAE